MVILGQSTECRSGREARSEEILSLTVNDPSSPRRMVHQEEHLNFAQTHDRKGVTSILHTNRVAG